MNTLNTIKEAIDFMNKDKDEILSFYKIYVNDMVLDACHILSFDTVFEKFEEIVCSVLS